MLFQFLRPFCHCCTVRVGPERLWVAILVWLPSQTTTDSALLGFDHFHQCGPLAILLATYARRGSGVPGHGIASMHQCPPCRRILGPLGSGIGWSAKDNLHTWYPARWHQHDTPPSGPGTPLPRQLYCWSSLHSQCCVHYHLWW